MDILPYSIADIVFIIYLHSGDIDYKNLDKLSFDL